MHSTTVVPAVLMALIVVGLLLYRRHFPQVKTRWDEAKARRKYFNTMRRELDLPLCEAAERYDQFMAGVRQALSERGIIENRAPEVVVHLLKVWPGGVVRRRVDLVLDRAQSLKVLDENYLPLPTTLVIDERFQFMVDFYNAIEC